MAQSYASLGTTKDALIEQFLPMVNRIANRLAIGLPAHVDRGDLVSSGIMGLLDALEKYDHSKGSIKNYVPLRVKGAMLDELRKMSWLPRSLFSKIREVENSYFLLSATLGRVPSEEELASQMHVSQKEMAMILAQINTKTLVHLEDYLFSGNENSMKVGECISDQSEWVNPEANLLRKEKQSRLTEAVETLSEREQLILHLYYKDELTLKEIGQILEITESRVSQIHSKIMISLRHKLKGI